MSAETYGWDWQKFAGSWEALKWNKRDISGLDRMTELARGRTAAVQAGGNLGIFPKRLAQSFETVYTFEPAADLFAMMMRNAPEPNIVKIQAALGDGPGLVSMARVRRDAKTTAGPHEGITHVAGPGVIPTLRVDDLGLPICDLLQLDLEGWELPALRGCVETIRRCRPVIAVEVNKNQGFVGHTQQEVRDAVLTFDYDFVERLHSDEIYVPHEWGVTVQ